MLKGEYWQAVLPLLMAADHHEGIQRGLRPPPEAVASLHQPLHNFEVPADGEYELLAVGEDAPTQTVALKKGDTLGFLHSGFMGLAAHAGEQVVRLPDRRKLYYWRPRPQQQAD